MDLVIKLVVMAGLAVAAWRVIAWAVRRASRRLRAAAGHGLGDDARRHSYADRIADDQLRAKRRDYSAQLAQEIAEKAAGWYPAEAVRDGGPAPWQEGGR